MRRLRLQIRRIGPYFRSVLVSGEAGTGKELVARALHGMSPYASGPFVMCHAAGFEDAVVERKTGPLSGSGLDHLMKMSQLGTLFLDDVSGMSLESQDRVLRALRKYEWEQSQLEASQRLDLRIIASAGEDLKILVSTGRFRQELYQRLTTVEIAVPPLRDRIEDLPELVRYFLGRFAMLQGEDTPDIADEAIERMQRYRWPGNVRELESVLRNGLLQSEGGMLETHHLPEFVAASEPEQPTVGEGGSVRLQDVVGRHVLRVLKDCGGNKLRAAEMLGISRSTLYRMLDTGASANSLR
jgi:DNA-binding NtrC family response regulator